MRWRQLRRLRRLWDPRKEDHIPDGARYLRDCKALLKKMEAE